MISGCEPERPDENGMTSALFSSDSITKRFDSPPAEARPWVRWWWMDRVSHDSITRDLEALKARGIGGVELYTCDGSILPEIVFGPRKMYWTPEWVEMVNFAVSEAKRLGLRLSINNVGTSSGSGGPWISIEESGKKLVWNSTWITGGSNVNVKLAQPETLENYYRDAAVVAYPCQTQWNTMLAASPKLTASSLEFADRPAEYVLDGNNDTHWSSDIGTSGGEYMDVTFDKPFTASAVYIVPRNGYTPSVINVQTSADGITFSTITRQSMPPNAPLTVRFDSTASRFFRIGFPSSHNPETRIGINELRLLADGDPAGDMPAFKYFAQQIASARLSEAGREAMFQSGNKNSEQAAPDTSAAAVIDISQYVNSEGLLNWNAPAGNWMILRFGETSIGERMHINFGIGHHVDYLNPDSVRNHFTKGIDPMLKSINPAVRSSITGIFEDSFEMPFNTWTEAFQKEFKIRRGYDILPWLPVLAGRVVNSQAQSERFLWDYRRTIADLYMTHWETARELCKERGFPYMAQAAGPQTYNFDALSQLGRTDIPMGEFWSGIYQPGVGIDQQHRGDWNDPVCETIRQAASAAHIYGRPIVACESFTGYSRPFVLDPFDVKAFGDRALCDGLNRFVIHLFMTQPLEEIDGKPAIVRLHAIDYNRRTTWFEQSRFWTDYLARCSAMLQAGLPVADVCCYLGEGAPAFVSPREYMQPQIPAGYDYDACNTETLLTARVCSGRICLPSGTSYAVLTLPPSLQSMTPDVLAHLRKLAKDGAIILGPKPKYSPSLFDHKNADAKVKSLADELWGISTQSEGEHAFGKGKVIWGKTVAEVLAASNCKPACIIKGADSVLFVQRHTDEGELFFISQQANKAIHFTASFRVTDPVVPELWDPAAGKREFLAVFNQTEGRIEIPLHLDARGSAFIVLRPGMPDKHLLTASHENNRHDFRVINDQGKLKLITSVPGKFKLTNDNGSVQTVTVPSVPQGIDLSADWDLTFEGLDQTIKMQKLVSWTGLPQADMRDYSGTVTYRKQFNWSKSDIRVELDLGSLKNIAEVSLNSKPVGVLWKPPYRLDITSVIKPGDNELEIKVTNLLVNRITADFKLPPDKRSLNCYGHMEQYRPGAESGKDGLLPSGLFGPIIICTPVELIIEKISNSPFDNLKLNKKDKLVSHKYLLNTSDIRICNSFIYSDSATKIFTYIPGQQTARIENLWVWRQTAN